MADPGDGPIVFDGTILGAGPPTGVARAFLTTLAQYTAVAGRPCVLLVPDHAVFEPPTSSDLELLRVPAGPFARQWRWPALLRRIHATLLHAPIAATPLRAPCPTVVTVHDLPWASPTRLRGEPGLRHHLAVRLALRRSRAGHGAILVPSHATAADLRRERGADRAVIHVVPHGVVLPASILEPEQRSGPFLFLGDRRARKNVDRLERAHKIASAMDPALPALQLVGPGQPNGYVDETRKHELLASCRALVHTTLFEGFGLPVLEGFAFGAPVLCSDIAAVAELAGDAALLVDPTDELAIAHALVRIHQDKALRASLTTRGRQVAGQHDVSRTATAWMAIHSTLLAGRES